MSGCMCGMVIESKEGRVSEGGGSGPRAAKSTKRIERGTGAMAGTRRSTSGYSRRRRYGGRSGGVRRRGGEGAGRRRTIAEMSCPGLERLEHRADASC